MQQYSVSISTRRSSPAASSSGVRPSAFCPSAREGVGGNECTLASTRYRSKMRTMSRRRWRAAEQSGGSFPSDATLGLARFARSSSAESWSLAATAIDLFRLERYVSTRSCGIELCACLHLLQSRLNLAQGALEVGRQPTHSPWLYRYLESCEFWSCLQLLVS